MKEKEKRTGRKAWYWAITLMIPLVAALVIISTYGYIKNYADKNKINPIEQKSSMELMFSGNYLLYKSLYEKANGETISYAELYFPDLKEMPKELYKEFYQGDIEEVKADLEDSMVSAVEEKFSVYGDILDYYIEDTDSKITVSNTREDTITNTDNYAFWIELVYDENGNAGIGHIQSENPDIVRKFATELTLSKNTLLKTMLQHNPVSNLTIETRQWYIQNGRGPVNCRIVYGIPTEIGFKLQNDYSWAGYSYSSVYDNYMLTDITEYILWSCVAVALLAMWLPLIKLRGKTYRESFFGKLPIEILGAAFMWCMACVSYIRYQALQLLGGSTEQIILDKEIVTEAGSAKLLAWGMHFLYLYYAFLTAWLFGLCLRVVREKGFKNYLKENWLFYRFLSWCKNKCVNACRRLEQIDVTGNVKKTILKIVLINAAILIFISSFWIGGWGFVILYSFFVYFALKAYIGRLQEKYKILLSKIEEISAGNLSADMTEDMGIFNPMKEKLALIQTGFRNAVDKEVKSQKMKTELITNVSHDLKTPLTAIITYVDLLKEENLSEEKRKEYLDTLERKSLRLKVLIEDLFEVSKANSGNVTLNFVDVDICSLIKQVHCELADKLKQANLDVRMELPDKKVYVPLDSQKTYRIYENLILNISKYALPGTRVYIQGILTEDTIRISLKNISAQEITVNAVELAERFVRGDESRNTEGSGLGLAIAKSFVELQGGKFILESDGDLFKVTTIFSYNRIMNKN